MNTSQSLCAMKLLLLLLLSILSYSCANINSFHLCLSSIITQKGKITNITYTPNTTNYASTLTNYIRNSRFNTSTSLKPTVILTPLNQFHVQSIVSCANKEKVQLKIRSGGHDYEGLSYTNKNPFVILDMFNLRSIDINIEDGMGWVQAGATVGELYYRIAEKTKNYGFPAGVCPTMGIGGHFSGGGYGNMIRKYGISVDNVIDAQIVDAKGRVLNRTQMGEDLFWAIRGGGGASFGVILSYKIKLVTIPQSVTVFSIPKILEENATFLIDCWQHIAPNLDRDLFIRVYIKPVLGPKRTASASFIGMYLGDANTLVTIMNAKFPELGLRKKDCKQMSWVDSTLFWEELPEGTPLTALLDRKGRPASSFKIKSDYVKTPLPMNIVADMLKKVAESGKIQMQFNPYGGRMSEIPESELPFPHRAGNLFKIQYALFWLETGLDVERINIDEIRNLHNFMTPYVSKNPREAYLNYRDIDNGMTDNGKNAYNQSKVFGVKYFKNNFDRLVKVKTEFDPENVFRYEQSIPPLLRK